MSVDMPELALAVFNNIRDRRTVPFTRMKPDQIAKEHLDLILEAANWAPTHKFTEPWRFVVFRGAGRERLAAALGDAYRDTAGSSFNEPKLQKTVTRPLLVPVILAICMEPGEAAGLPEFEEILAVGCAVQNLHLTAQSLGIGGAWSTPKYLDHPALRELLGLAGRGRCLGFFYLGYPSTDWPQSKRQPIAEKTRWVDS